MIQTRALLAKIPLFSELSQDDLAQLEQAVSTRNLKAGERLMRQGQEGSEFYAILSGSLQLSVRSGGESEPFVVAVLGPGDYLGEMALLDDTLRSATADALEACELVVLERQRFLEVVRDRPEVALSLLRGMARRLRKTNEDAAAIAHLDVYQRLVRKLSQLAAEQGIASGAVTLDKPLSPEVLGPMIGAEAAGVKLLLDLMEFDGLVRRSGDRITVREVEAMARSRGPQLY